MVHSNDIFRENTEKMKERSKHYTKIIIIICVCVHVDKWETLNAFLSCFPPLCLETQSLSEFGAHHFSLVSCPLSSGYPICLCPPTLGFQSIATLPSFYTSVGDHDW